MPLKKEDELREEYKRFVLSDCEHHNEVQCDCNRIADYWLQKMSEQKERLIKEVEGMIIADVYALPTNDFCYSEYDLRKVKNGTLEDILHRLQSNY